MKKIEALELEEEDLEDKREEGSSFPRWKLKDTARQAMQESSLVVFSGQVVKNRSGRITSDLGQMLQNWWGKTKPLIKVWTLGELRKQPPRNTGIKVTKSRQALTLRWGKWKNFPYDIPLEHLKTERGILKWTLHLAEKSWVSREQLEDFMQAALEVAGIDIHNAPKLDSVNR